MVWHAMRMHSAARVDQRDEKYLIYMTLHLSRPLNVFTVLLLLFLSTILLLPSLPFSLLPLLLLLLLFQILSAVLLHG